MSKTQTPTYQDPDLGLAIDMNNKSMVRHYKVVLSTQELEDLKARPNDPFQRNAPRFTRRSDNRFKVTLFNNWVMFEGAYSAAADAKVVSANELSVTVRAGGRWIGYLYIAVAALLVVLAPFTEWWLLLFALIPAGMAWLFLAKNMHTYDLAFVESYARKTFGGEWEEK